MNCLIIIKSNLTTLTLRLKSIFKYCAVVIYTNFWDVWITRNSSEFKFVDTLHTLAWWYIILHASNRNTISIKWAITLRTNCALRMNKPINIFLIFTIFWFTNTLWIELKVRIALDTLSIKYIKSQTEKWNTNSGIIFRSLIIFIALQTIIIL